MSNIVKQESSSLVLEERATGLAVLSFAPKSLQDVRDLAIILADSGIGPKVWRNPNAGVVMLMTALELGLTVSQAFRGMYEVGGKPALESGLILAIVRSYHDCKYFYKLPVTDEEKEAKFVTKRNSDPEPVEFRYTLDDAKKAGLLGKDNWQHHPKDMLRAKAITRLAKLVYPDLLFGMAMPDDSEDVGVLPEEPAPTTPAVVDKAPSRSTRSGRGSKQTQPQPQQPPTDIPDADVEDEPPAFVTQGKGLTSEPEPQPPKPAPSAAPATVAAPTKSAPETKPEPPKAAEKPAEPTPPKPEKQPFMFPVDGPPWVERLRAASTLKELDDASMKAMFDDNIPEEEVGRIYNARMEQIIQAGGAKE